MYHSIRAVVGEASRVEHLARWSFAVAQTLPQGFTLVLVTRAMREDIEDLVGFDGGLPYPELEHLSHALERVITQGNQAEPIAYFETCYTADVGTEAAVVWQRGKRVLGPLSITRPTFRDPRVDPTAPVCAALGALGVRHRPGSDPFDALGLARFPCMPRGF
jgi:hypothetical protein